MKPYNFNEKVYLWQIISDALYLWYTFIVWIKDIKWVSKTIIKLWNYKYIEDDTINSQSRQNWLKKVMVEVSNRKIQYTQDLLK